MIGLTAAGEYRQLFSDKVLSMKPIHFLTKMRLATLSFLSTHVLENSSVKELNNSIKKLNKRFLAKAKQLISEVCNKIKKIWTLFEVGFIECWKQLKPYYCEPKTIQSNPIISPAQNQIITTTQEETTPQPITTPLATPRADIAPYSSRRYDQYQLPIDDNIDPALTAQNLIEGLLVFYAFEKAVKPYSSNISSLFTLFMIMTFIVDRVGEKPFCQRLKEILSTTPHPKQETPAILSPICETENQLILTDEKDPTYDPQNFFEETSFSNPMDTAARTHHLVGSISLASLFCRPLEVLIDGTITLEGFFPENVERTQHQNVYLVKYVGQPKHNYGNKKFAYLNGSATGFRESVLNAQAIANIAQTDVILGYIPTVTFVHDLFGALFERNNLLELPQKHAEICRNVCIEGTKRGSELILMPHSRAFHAVKKAHDEYSSTLKNVFKRTCIYALAGSSEISVGHSFKEVVNTVCRSDYVIRLLDNGAVKRQKKHGMLQEVEIQGAKKSFFWPGHSFESPTTQHVIKQYVMKVRRG